MANEGGKKEPAILLAADERLTDFFSLPGHKETEGLGVPRGIRPRLCPQPESQSLKQEGRGRRGKPVVNMSFTGIHESESRLCCFSKHKKSTKYSL